MTAESLLLLLGSYAVKSTTIFAAAALSCLVFRRFGPSYRHLVWTAAFLGVLILPALEIVLPREPLPVLPATTYQTPVTQPPITQLPVLPPTSLSSEPEVLPTATPEPFDLPALAEPPPPTPAPPRPTLAFVLAAIWIGGVVICLTQQFFSLWLLNRSAARCPSGSTEEFLQAANKVGVTRRWRLVFGRIAGAPGPMMWGVLRPTVAMPEESRSWPPDQFDSVLIHELVHVRRLDCLTQSLAAVVCALHWFNPVAWLSMTALRRESESATDRAVLEAGVKPSTYADALLNAAFHLTQRRRTLLYAGVPLMKQSKIEARVRAVLSHEARDIKVTRLGGLATFAAALLVVAPCATLQASAQKPNEVPAKAVNPPSAAVQASAAVPPKAATQATTPKSEHVAPQKPHSARSEVLKRYRRASLHDRNAREKFLEAKLREEEHRLQAAQMKLLQQEDALRRQRALLDAQNRSLVEQRQDTFELARQTGALSRSLISRRENLERAAQTDAQIKAARAQIMAAEETAKDQEARYRVGVASKDEMLKAREDLLKLQAQGIAEQSLKASEQTGQRSRVSEEQIRAAQRFIAQAKDLAREREEQRKSGASDAQLKAVGAQLRAAEQAAKDNAAQYREGLQSKSEVLRAQADLESTRATLLSAQNSAEAKAREDMLKRMRVHRTLDSRQARRMIEVLKAEIQMERANRARVEVDLKTGKTSEVKARKAALEKTLRVLQEKLRELGNANHP